MYGNGQAKKEIETSSKLCDLLARGTNEITVLHCSQSKRVRLSLGDIKISCFLTVGPLAFIKSLERETIINNAIKKVSNEVFAQKTCNQVRMYAVKCAVKCAKQ